MLGKCKLGACLGNFGCCADRYCRSGYGRGGRTIEEMLDLATQVGVIDGLELVSNWHVNDDNIDYMKKLFAERHFEVSMVVPDLWTQEKWGQGSLASVDSRIRKEAVEEIKRSMDWAEAIGCPYVDVWPGQDGYDYPFQADYSEAWKRLRDGMAECSTHNPKVKVLVEYKLKEPRTHCYVSSAAKTVLLLQDLENVGCLLDIGHSLAAGENMAEAAALLSNYGILDYLHLNDNYRLWDDDMIFASVNIPEALELVYWIKKLNYSSWLTLDIFAYREEKVPAARNCFAWLRALMEIVDRVGLERINEVVESEDGNQACSLIREMLIR